MRNLFRWTFLLGFTICLSSVSSIFAEDDEKTGTFSGVITLEGEIPDLPPLVKKGAIVKDAVVCAAQTIPDKSLAVNQQNKGIANVFVYLTDRPKNAPAVAVPKQVILNCQNCQFEPRAQVVRTGQNVRVTNNDPIPQNFHNKTVRSAQRNYVISPKDQQGIVFDYDRAERRPIRIISDIHPWMTAWQLPLDHPYAAVTDKDGKFKIEGLPPGAYKFRIWHERAGWLEKSFQFTIETESVEAELSYPADLFVKKDEQAK